MASMFEEMDDDLEGEDAAAETTEAEPAADELDGELAMLAEKLGFEGEKAQTFKKFVERCVQLREEGSYSEPALATEGAAEGDIEDDDLEL